MASIKCEMCGARLEADSEAELAKLMQEHAKEAHDIDMSDQEAARQVTEGMLSDI
jgi:predicted small metal-binding protein